MFFVATNDERCGMRGIGSCQGTITSHGRGEGNDRARTASRAKGEWGELRRMSVDASYRRGRIATKLHDALMDFAKRQNLTGVFLGTSSLQGPAIRCYLKFGYKLKRSRGVPSKLMSGSIKLLTYDLEVSEFYKKYK